MTQRLNVVQDMKRAASRVVARVTDAVLPQALTARLRDERSWREWVDGLSADLLDDLALAPPHAKRELFRRNVKLVEIETHAKCNRLCSFCPNVDGNRLKNEKLTDAAMLNRVFDELGSIDYRRQIKVARYSEPLRNPESLYACISSARTRVPNAELAIVTNTDYLKPSVLDQLVAAGLDVMYMSIYLRDKERWSTELARAYNARLAHTLGLAETARSETSSVVRYSYEYKGMTVRSACINFDENGSNRGGLLAQYSDQLRKGPCREPFETFVIDYTGDVMPCCNLLSDRPEHRNYIIGNLLDAHASIFDLYAGKLSSWRRGMVTFGQKQQPCCDMPTSRCARWEYFVDRLTSRQETFVAEVFGTGLGGSERQVEAAIWIPR